MTTKKLNEYLKKLIENGEIEFNMDILDSVELTSEEQEYLDQTDEKRLNTLKKSFNRVNRLKVSMENPQKTQHFHQFYQYFREWNNLSEVELSKILSVNQKTLEILNDVNKKITEFPVKILIKLIKFMEVKSNDIIELIKASFKLAIMQPKYGQQLSRYHDKESADKGDSIKNAMNELLLKSKQVNQIDYSELEDYISELERGLEDAV
jgi:hypothetical protein